jgi:uncharacterized protein YlaI
MQEECGTRAGEGNKTQRGRQNRMNTDIIGTPVHTYLCVPCKCRLLSFEQRYKTSFRLIHKVTNRRDHSNPDKNVIS